jgi:hypothetical protein
VLYGESQVVGRMSQVRSEEAVSDKEYKSRDLWIRKGDHSV